MRKNKITKTEWTQTEMETIAEKIIGAFPNKVNVMQALIILDSVRSGLVRAAILPKLRKESA